MMFFIAHSSLKGGSTMKKFVIFLTVLTLSLLACSAIQKESLDVRIQRVENGLINPVIIKGQPEK